MLENLNDRQRQAVVNTDGPMLVLAGAGSGKTRVLTTRIAYLIKEKKVNPWNILAFTFTNKAAQEMKDRVQGLLDMDVSSLWIGTFHSIGVRILRRSADRIGYDSNFTIYDRDDQKTLLKEVYKDLDISDKMISYNLALSVISKAKNEGLNPDKHWERTGSDPRELTLARIYRAYEEKKEVYNAFDFDDLIVKTIELLKNDEEVRSYYQRKFDYVFVDEYQDTNGAQYEMIRTLAADQNNICVVGDSDQSIYGWRGADISNILNFEKDYPGADLVMLEENYRSSQAILDAANELISNNAERKDKKLWTARSGGDQPIYREFPSENNEAKGLVVKAKDLRQEGLAYSELAILYRTNAQSRALEEELVHQGVPYRVVGGLKFYDRKEIKDILAYLTVIVNPKDDLALRRIINEPKRGIGQASLAKLDQAAEKSGLSLADFIMTEEADKTLPGRAGQGLAEFKDIISQARHLLEDKALVFAVSDIIDLTGLASPLKEEDTVEARSRLENIDSFLSAIGSFEEANPEASLENYLAQVSLMSDLDKTEDARGVSLMTVHSAKGLEFPVVFVAGLEDGLFPSKYSIDEGNIEEERRLFYVAITRAEDRLFLSSSQARRIYGQLVVAKRSRFIDELKDTIEWKEEEGSEYMVSNNLKNNPRDKSQNWDEKYMKYSIQDRKASLEKQEDADYKLGDKVKHKKFGQGTIVSIEGNDLLISFEDAGIKKLRSDIAPLERV